jgi:site-specific recombinase XerD
MARRPRSPQTENRASRLRLKPRRKPYYTAIAPGIRLGYRRNQGAGSWTVKVANGHGGHWIKAFAIADDHQDADGATVLTYWQAIDKARAVAGGENGNTIVAGDRPVTVAEAIANYAAELKSRNADAYNVTRIRFHLSPALANKIVGQLTARDLRHWRDGLLKKGLAPASADRSGRALKAALNLASKEDPTRITNTAAWRDGLARLPDAEVARNDILTDSDVRALVAAAYALSPEYGLWVETHATTGARTSQLERLEVRDLQDSKANPRLMMPSSHKGKRRRVERKPVAIPASLAVALRHAAAARAPEAPLLVPPGGETLLRNWLKRIVKAAKLKPGTTMYALRHSSIVRMLLAGTPIRIVAVHHDTSVPMIEKNYSRHIGDHADTLVRRGLIDMSAPAGTNVVPLAR